MKNYTLFVLLALAFSLNALSQDLLQERIWKISERKRSIFLDKGVFHSDENPMKQNLVGVRNSYVPARGYERVVFDFSSNKPPRVYGKISNEDNKVYIDFFNTSLGTKISKLKNIKHLKDINFFNIDEKDLSVEMNFSSDVSLDVFYLENPARLVVDIKK